MDKRELKIDYRVCRNAVPAPYAELCRKAGEAAGTAYCVCSGFAVGAAVLLADGEIIQGSNQENAAYPSGLCAERTALFYAGASRPNTAVKALAVTACRGGVPVENAVFPCGACRQVMAEVVRRFGRDFDVIMIGRKESILVKASALLPFSFDF